jgi:tetratricopeptide (TPR) repeat protein
MIPDENEYIKKCLGLSTSDLWTDLGMVLQDQGFKPMHDMLGLSRKRIDDRIARYWFMSKEDAIRNLVCIRFDYCGKKKKLRFEKRVTLISALASTLTSLFAGPAASHMTAAIMLAILLVRHGLDSFCGCDSAQIYIDQASEAGVSFEKRISLLRTALKESPLSTSAHYHLGLTYDEKGDTARAIECYKSAIDLDPDEYYALNNLGYLLLKTEIAALSEALGYVERAFRLAPDNDVVNHSYGLALVRADRASDAIEHLLRAVETNKTAERSYHLAQAYARSGNRERALEICISMVQEGLLDFRGESIHEFVMSGGHSELI